MVYSQYFICFHDYYRVIINIVSYVAFIKKVFYLRSHYACHLISVIHKKAIQEETAMNNEERLNLLINGYQQLRKAFKWDHQLIHMLGSLILISDNKPVDIEAIKAVRQIIKNNSGIFSNFRGNNELLLSIMVYCKSSEQRKPEQVFSEVQEAYQHLRQAGLKNSLYLVTGALHLAQAVYEDDLSTSRTVIDLADKTQAFYLGMKQQHFWLTSQENQVYALMLALADLPHQETLSEAERFFQDLRRLGFSRSSALQNLSLVMTLGKDNYELRRDSVDSLNRYLITRGYKLTQYQMPFLGVMALVTSQPEKVADTAVEMAQWLSDQKGFGRWSIDKKTRFTLAASLACLDHIEKNEGQISQSVLTGSIQSAILAQQAAMIAAITSASAASTAASASR